MQVALTKLLAGNQTLSDPLACITVCCLIIKCVIDSLTQHIANDHRFIQSASTLTAARTDTENAK